jgi:hypothetical protein
MRRAGVATAGLSSTFAIVAIVILSNVASAQGTDPNLNYYKEPGLYPTRSYLNQSFSEDIDRSPDAWSTTTSIFSSPATAGST